MKGWVLAFPLLLAAAPALAQEGDEAENDGDGMSFIVAAPSSPEECRLSIAAWVDFADAVAPQSPMRRRCVAIEGYWRENRFYPTLGAAMGDARRIRRFGDRERLGIYADWEAIAPVPHDAPERVTIVGVMGECRHLYRDGSMVLGYCHLNGGPLIRVSQIIRE